MRTSPTPSPASRPAPAPVVLVIHGDADERGRLERCFTSIGARVLAIADGAIVLGARNAPDLIVAHLSSDGVGLGFLERVVASEALGHVPVLLLAPGDVATKVRAFELGAADCVAASIEEEELIARARGLVRRGGELTRLRTQSLVDQLTGVYSRRGVERLLASEVERARREGDPLALAFIDLDGFKAVNDVHGHEAGDAVLRAFAAELGGVVRATDSVGRLGGDEFVVILPAADGHDLDGFTQRVAEVARHAGAHLPSTPIGASVGFATLDPNDPAQAEIDGARLLAEADAAMYEVKRNRPRRRGRVEAAPRSATGPHLRLVTSLLP